jgi:hypothetical protein
MYFSYMIPSLFEVKFKQGIRAAPRLTPKNSLIGIVTFKGGVPGVPLDGGKKKQRPAKGQKIGLW